MRLTLLPCLAWNWSEHSEVEKMVHGPFLPSSRMSGSASTPSSSRRRYVLAAPMSESRISWRVGPFCFSPSFKRCTRPCTPPVRLSSVYSVHVQPSIHSTEELYFGRIFIFVLYLCTCDMDVDPNHNILPNVSDAL
eukprot:scaffold3153_cov111-Isochrysis_galbana.AAC.1